MGSIALRNMRARKLRTILTSLAIVFGVMMVAGTYVLTDTIEQSFDDIFTESNQGVDAVVTSDQQVETEDGTEPPVDASVLESVRGVDGVEAADGGITDPQVAIIGSDGESIGGGGAPTFAFSTTDERVRPARVPRGRAAAIRRRGRDRQGGRREGRLRARRQGHAGRQDRGPGVHAGRASPPSATSTPSAAPASPC